MRKQDVSKIKPTPDLEPLEIYRLFIVHEDGSRVHNIDYFSQIYAEHQARRLLTQYHNRTKEQSAPPAPDEKIKRVEMYASHLIPSASSLVAAWLPPRSVKRRLK